MHLNELKKEKHTQKQQTKAKTKKEQRTNKKNPELNGELAWIEPIYKASLKFNIPTTSKITKMFAPTTRMFTSNESTC